MTKKKLYWLPANFTCKNLFNRNMKTPSISKWIPTPGRQMVESTPHSHFDYFYSFLLHIQFKTLIQQRMVQRDSFVAINDLFIHLLEVQMTHVNKFLVQLSLDNLGGIKYFVRKAVNQLGLFQLNFGTKQ